MNNTKTVRGTIAALLLAGNLIVSPMIARADGMDMNPDGNIETTTAVEAGANGVDLNPVTKVEASKSKVLLADVGDSSPIPQPEATPVPYGAETVFKTAPAQKQVTHQRRVSTRYKGVAREDLQKLKKNNAQALGFYKQKLQVIKSGHQNAVTRSEITRIASRITVLEQDQSEIAGSLEVVIDEMNDLKESDVRQNATNTRQDETIAKIIGHQKFQDKELHDVQAEVKDARGTYDSINDRFGSVDSLLEAARGKWDSIAARFTGDEKAIKTIDGRVTANEKEIAEARGEFKTLDARLDDMSRRKMTFWTLALAIALAAAAAFMVYGAVAGNAALRIGAAAATFILGGMLIYWIILLLNRISY